ncbi:aldehyde dehydrogenase 3B1 [Ophiocordyceps camponoti-floridani]|uniref:Aldehyde dehydrogenase n=1 Tax=Ophiocordyceps camponoti-floridani TaxID=2030778 RepID=A0A8H4Q9V3_9HYPO|nr:aldehyde dehydrogenase 3B1 [Ophiocordyceps camponoti-floridani]
MNSIPAFAPTPIAEISDGYHRVRSTFRSGRLRDLEYRKKQIRRLYWGLDDMRPVLIEALRRDMGKCAHEANLTEIDWVQVEAIGICDHLDDWASDESVVNLPFSFRLMKPRIRHEPLGTLLIIGAYNFPVMLGVTAVLGALAAGNTVVIKPSEQSPHSAMALGQLFDRYLDPDLVYCVNGSISETQVLLDLKFDKVAFTGGRKAGTIVASKAAQSLTPVLLELGGRNPAFINEHANVAVAARRLLWQKCLNAGQICLTQNYVLIHRPLVTRFIEELKLQYRIFMPKGAKASPDFSRIVNQHHFRRIKAMLDNSNGKIVMGGGSDETSLFIEPTVVLVDDVDDSMMAEETFGPVWSIMPYDSLDEAIGVANRVDPTPLALYTFGSDEENNKVLALVTSGGACINDGMFHASLQATPLGGVGGSGMGNYHGYYSFRAFSHQRVICNVPSWSDRILRVRYMPYSAPELRRYRKMLLPKPNFDREGNVVRDLSYWLGLVLALGGRGMKSIAVRWGVLIAVALGLGLGRRFSL